MPGIDSDLPDHSCTAVGTIAIIDDDATWTDAVTRYLRSEGFEVLTAGDGKEGLGLLEEISPSLVILDVSMPRMSGLQMLRALPNTRRTAPVLVISADTQAATIRKALAAGAAGFLPKPVSPNLLIHTIRSLISLELKKGR